MCLLANTAFAKVETSGFLSLTGLYIDSHDNYRNLSNGSLDYGSHSRVGLSFTAQLDSQWEAIVQLIGMPESTEYEARPQIKLELAVAKWNVDDHHTLRFGRLRTPFNLVSEYYEVGYLHPWLAAPGAVYELIPVSSYFGISGMKKFDLGKWSFEVEVISGTTEYSGQVVASDTTSIGTGMVGGAINIHRSNFAMKLAYSGQQLDLETNVFIPAGTTIPGDSDSPYSADITASTPTDFGWTNIYAFGLSYVDQDWLFMAEAIQLETKADQVFALSFSRDFKDYYGWYATLGRYLFNKKHLLHLTSSFYEAGREGLTEYQNELGWNYYSSDSSVFKVSISNIYLPSDSTGGFIADSIVSELDLERSNYTLVGFGLDLIF
tara:strand:- start:85085 stop:86218 length:1134 start_codon:yes stop_codon:yes gene_type:complete